jgi:hypothetical protein
MSGIGEPTALSASAAALVVTFGLVALGCNAIWCSRSRHNNAYLAYAGLYTLAAAGTLVLTATTWNTYWERQRYSIPGMSQDPSYFHPPVQPLPGIAVAVALLVLAVVGLVVALVKNAKFETSLAALGMCIAIVVCAGTLSQRYVAGDMFRVMQVGWVLVALSGLYFTCRCVIAYGDRRVDRDRALRDSVAATRPQQVLA